MRSKTHEVKTKINKKLWFVGTICIFSAFFCWVKIPQSHAIMAIIYISPVTIIWIPITIIWIPVVTIIWIPITIIWIPITIIWIQILGKSHAPHVLTPMDLFSVLIGGSCNFWVLLFRWHHTSSQMRRSVSLLERSLISVVIIYLTTSGNGHTGPTYKIKTPHPTQASFSVVLVHEYRLRDNYSLIILE